MSPHDVVYDHLAHTVQPLHAEGDAYYGLVPGTNGTAAETRRAGAAPPGIAVRWLRHDGREPIGLQYRPASGVDSFVSPWGG